MQYTENQVQFSRDSSLFAMRRSAVKRLAIKFDRDDGIFKPGESVSGRILVSFLKPEQITGLQLTIVGESVVQWSLDGYKPVDKSDPDDECRFTNKAPFTLMTGREEYFSSKFHLLGKDSGPHFTLPAGQTAYPFKYQLPSNLPCSFVHEHGYVRYTIKATIDTDSPILDEIVNSFTIISTYDLHRNPKAFLPIREEVNKSFVSTCICSAGKIYARLSVPSIGFVPGQLIPVTVHCENESIVDVAKIKVSLRRNLKFHAKSPAWETKSEETTVAHTQRVAPFTNDSEERVTIQLRVPPLPPTGLEHCGLIDVDYVLRIVMCFSGTHFSIKRRFPILIGTIPRHGFVNRCQIKSGYRPSAVIPDRSYRDPRNSPLPSYASIVYGAVTTTADQIKATNGVGDGNTFTSRYPAYNRIPQITVPDPLM